MKIFLLIQTFFITGFLSASEKLLQVEIQAQKTADVPTPVSVTVKNFPSAALEQSLKLVEIRSTGAVEIPFQIERDGEIKLWWILPANDSNNSRTFELQFDSPSASSPVGINLGENSLTVHQNNRGVLKYHFALLPPPPGRDSLFTRSGFIHPVWTPQGKVLSRIHASDHIHHMGFWHPWTKTMFEGREVDFWNIGDGQGTVRFVRFEDLQAGPVFASFTALQEFVDFTAPAGEKIALNEWWKIRVWNTEISGNKIWLWDFSTRQKCASASPLIIKKYRYGGFGFRGTADWEMRNSDFLTSKGKTRKDGNGTRARWCSVFGQTDRGHGGIVFLSYPQNHSFPEPMRIWPDGDIFFGFCPVVYEDWEMVPGESYLRKYRIIVYDGKMEVPEIEKYWQAFANPVELVVDLESYGF